MFLLLSDSDSVKKTENSKVWVFNNKQYTQAVKWNVHIISSTVLQGELNKNIKSENQNPTILL